MTPHKINQKASVQLRKLQDAFREVLLALNLMNAQVAQKNAQMLQEIAAAVVPLQAHGAAATSVELCENEAQQMQSNTPSQELSNHLQTSAGLLLHQEPVPCPPEAENFETMWAISITDIDLERTAHNEPIHVLGSGTASMVGLGYYSGVFEGGQAERMQVAHSCP